MSLGPHDLHQLARSSMGTLTTYRLLLGRCLLAFQRGNVCHELGYSGAVHYACAALGMQDWRARELMRVAGWLEDLPALRRATEDGEISWCKLREVVRVATPEDEVDWLTFCQLHPYHEVERRVRMARSGEEESARQAVEKTELRLNLSPESVKLLERAFQGISQEAGRALAPAQALEYLCAEYLSRHGGDLEKKLEKARHEARLDLAAEAECSARNGRVGPDETRPMDPDETCLMVPDQACAMDPDQACAMDPDETCLIDPDETRPMDPDETGPMDPDETCLMVSREATAGLSGLEVDDLWLAATASHEVDCPGNSSVQLVRPARAHWENPRLEFNPESRKTTPAQRAELLRRDGYRCRVPGCCNHLFLEVHHVKFYCEGGKTVPENLVLLCGKCHKNVHEGHLRIEGVAPQGLRFLDRGGRDLGWQTQLELAQWLDFFVGWKGGEADSHQERLAGHECEIGYINQI